jgi:hypothetical protein
MCAVILVSCSMSKLHAGHDSARGNRENGLSARNQAMGTRFCTASGTPATLCCLARVTALCRHSAILALRVWSMLASIMSKPSKVEIALASVGIVLLGLIAYWALDRNQPRPPSELYYVPERDAGEGRGPGHAAQGRPRVHAPASAPADAARIQGQVRDLLTGEGVAGVTVAFVPAGTSTEITAESDAQGGYALALAPGRYRARAVGQEVVALDAAAIAPGTGDDDDDARLSDDTATREILVAARSGVGGLDIYVVRLARVHGRVVDGNGEPVGEALVRHRTSLLDRAIDSRHTAPTGEAWSGADGAFAVLVPPGRVTLLASAPGRTPSSTRILWVAPGAELRGVEIVMDQGADVPGRVVDAAGKGVAGARVVGRVEIDGAPAGEIGAVSSGDGRFLLGAVPPGRLVLQAEAAGYAPSPAVVVTVSGEPGRREDVVIRLAAPATLAGRVVDEQGAGIAGATVRALRPMSQIALPGVTTDAQGQFDMLIAPGPVDVTVTAPGFAPGRASGVAASSRAVVITLARGGAIAGVVTGRGQPLSHFTVHVVQRSAPDGAPGAAIDFWQQGMRVVSPDGSYRLSDLPSGRYSVTAAAPGLAPVEQPDVAVAPGREARVDLELAPGASLVGTVRNARSQAPVAGAVVRLSTGSELAMTYTDAGGGFAISDIAPGRRSLEVQHPGYVGRVESGIELAQGAERRVDVALAPAAAGADRALEIAGIGAVLVTQEQRLMVQDVVPHGPAAVAGIEPGEEVFSIDGRSTREQSFGDNIEGIRGLVGTVVRLGLRLGERERFLDVVRGTVRVTPPGQPDEE